MVKIIGISGISGAGSTTITKALGKALHATTLFWDDFDADSLSPDDYVEWFKKSGDYAAWFYPALENALKELKEGRRIKHPAIQEELVATPLIIFDGPLGRKHVATSCLVDYFIHLDTSMDVALARRLIRNYTSNSEASLHGILEELEWYLSVGRPLFDAHHIKALADFVVNGDLSTQEITDTIISQLELLSLC